MRGHCGKHRGRGSRKLVFELRYVCILHWQVLQEQEESICKKSWQDNYEGLMYG